MVIKIVEQNIFNKSFNFLDIQTVNVDLDNCAVVVFGLKQKLGYPTEHVGMMQIPPNEYNQWGSDDNYLTNLILQKLNFTKVTE